MYTVTYLLNKQCVQKYVQSYLFERTEIVSIKYLQSYLLDKTESVSKKYEQSYLFGWTESVSRKWSAGVKFMGQGYPILKKKKITRVITIRLIRYKSLLGSNIQINRQIDVKPVIFLFFTNLFFKNPIQV